MSKMSKCIKLNYSPNFETKKRKIKEIKFLIFHYTGMKKEKDAINRLTNIKSKVSSHYVIKKNGEIVLLVPELYIAWHAGISTWKNYKNLNKNSIGIEICNPGHNFKYKKYSSQQIKSVLKLSKNIIKKYKIKPNFILGHSDIAPDRKKDPGEKFPWKYLAKYNVGYWYNINRKKLLKVRNKKINNIELNEFRKNLVKIGYLKNLNTIKPYFMKKIIEAFQRRFRQELINGKIDRECMLLSNKLVKKLK